MNRFVIAAVAAVGGAVAMTAGDAEAKAKGQLFICRTGRAVYKDNLVSKTGTAMCNVGKSTFFNYAIASSQVKIAGLAGTTTGSWLLPCLSTKDIRQDGVLPLTFRPGGTDDTVAGTYGITRGLQLTGSWVTDENDRDSFQVTFKKFDAANSRVSGSFSGTLVPGDTPAGQKPLKISKGNFNIIVNFNGF